MILCFLEGLFELALQQPRPLLLRVHLLAEDFVALGFSLADGFELLVEVGLGRGAQVT